MSLNDRERAATSRELKANFELSGLSYEDVQAALGMDAARLQATLHLDGAHPADVWLLCDYLERIIRDKGASPSPYSSLRPEMRSAAQGWFSLTNVDEVISRDAK